MTRKNKLMLNSASALIYQIITIVCGFILPHLFLTYYGSAVNGLVSSISQFLGFISLAECGVGAVVQSTLYKPLADGDMITVSKVVVSSERFFKRIAYILLGYTVALMFIYPIVTLKSFDYFFTFVLIAVISISTFAQYYLGMTYRLLLNADQLGFIQYSIHAVALVLNTGFCILLMVNGASIQLVKLVTSLIFLIQPLLLTVIARKRYSLDLSVSFAEEPIKQKWNGLAQHIAAVVLGNTDIVVLTFLSTLENVSVYTVYNLVVNGVKQIVLSLTNGMQAFFGNMLAKKEIEALQKTFEVSEWILHTVVTLVFSVTAILIVPFVQVYTKQISDTNYIQPVFAYILVAAQAVYCLRLPYNTVVLAAGHYRETQWSAIFEALINVLISIILVIKFDLVGVAIGTLAAMTYRTAYLVFYLSKHILHRKVLFFMKQMLIDMIYVCVLLGCTRIFKSFFVLGETNYYSWVLLAIKVGCAALLISVLINLLFYRNNIKYLLLKVKKTV